MKGGVFRLGRHTAEALLVAALWPAASMFFAPSAYGSTVRVEYEDTLHEVEVTETSEAEVKAAFLLRFLDFVTWPDDVGDTLRICVSGDAKMADMLSLLAEQENRRDGAPYAIAVSRIGSPGALDACHMLALGRDALDGLLPDKGSAPRPGLLTVNTWNTAREGVIIHLFREGDRVRFDISRPLAKEAGIRISSKLLSLAQRQSDRDK